MNHDLSYISALLGGFLSFLSPCVLPLVPGYLSWLAGLEWQQACDDGRSSRRRLLYASFLFVSGFTLVFVLMGATVAGIGQSLGMYRNEITAIAGVILMIMGLHMTGLIRLQLLYKQLRLDIKDYIPTSLQSAMPFLVGIAFGFGWTPCIGPILSGILILAANSNDVAQGMFLLFLYALGLGLPFLLTALAIGQSMVLIRRFGSTVLWIERFAGVLLIGTGIALFFNQMALLSGLILEIFPFLATLG